VGRKIGRSAAGVAVAFASAFGLVAAVTVITAPPAASAKVTHVLGFGVTGAPQQFVVPAGVKSLDVTLAGGQGGDGSTAEDSQAERTPGGKGAVVNATMAVTPGQVLYVYAGDKGTPAAFDLPEGTTACTPAFGGGGAGGFQPGGYHSRPMCGPGGGGASDIRTGTDLSTRLVVAGGGGSSAQDFAGWDAACGPYGGGDSAAQGQPAAPCHPQVVGGMPGTATAGGAGADPYYAGDPDPHWDRWPADTACGAPILGPVIPGGNGTLGQGGAGGYQALAVAGPNWVPVGGAGGGGYYGGGGGASMEFDGSFCGDLSGGGGGSSWIAPKTNLLQLLLGNLLSQLGLAPVGTIAEGANVGQGWVTITWTTS
jgi:hypothetical protein